MGVLTNHWLSSLYYISSLFIAEFPIESLLLSLQATRHLPICLLTSTVLYIMVQIKTHVSFLLLVPLQTSAFTPTHTARSSISRTNLNLHPDQASELEAAATELLKSHHNLNGDNDNTVNDDTNKPRSFTLSVASSSTSSSNTSSQKKKWWSATFSSFVRRHGSWMRYVV